LKYKSNWTLEKAVFEGASLKATFRAISASLIKAAISVMTIYFLTVVAAIGLAITDKLSRSSAWMV